MDNQLGNATEEEILKFYQNIYKTIRNIREEKEKLPLYKELDELGSKRKKSAERADYIEKNYQNAEK